jgi:hypothetical protein
MTKVDVKMSKNLCGNCAEIQARMNQEMSCHSCKYGYFWVCPICSNDLRMMLAPSLVAAFTMMQKQMLSEISHNRWNLGTF